MRAADGVAARIAAGVATRLNDADGLTEGGPESAGLCERGFQHLRASTVEDLEKAVACFESARRVDPGFSAPWRGLALSRATLVDAGYVSDREALRQASQEARQGAELAPGDAAARAAVGFVEALSRNWAAADEATRLAVELDGESAEARVRRGFFLRARGRPIEAIAELDVATGLDDSDPRALTASGWAYYCDRRYDDALQRANAASYFAPRFVPAHLLCAAAAFAAGMTDKGETSCREALLIAPEDPWARALVGDKHADSRVIAAAVALRSNPGAAIGLLETAVDEGDPQLLKLRWPLFDPLREHDRFDVIMR